MNATAMQNVKDTTAQDLLNDKPSAIEVARVEELWGRFNSSTQFLLALKQVLVKYEVENELSTLEQFLPTFATVEAHDLNVPHDQPVPPFAHTPSPATVLIDKVAAALTVW